MSTEPDHRLIEDPEFEVLIQDARAIEIDDAWLDAQLDAILNKLDPPPSDGGPSSTGGGHGGQILSSAVKLIAPIAIGAGIYFTLIPSQNASTDVPHNEVSQSTNPSAVESPSVELKTPKEVASPGNIPSSRALSQERPAPQDNRDHGPIQKSGLGLGRSEAPPENDASALPVLPERKPSRQPTPVPTLGRTLDTIKAARDLASQGDIDDALTLLEPLLKGPYRPEALSAHAKLAYQFQRYEEAIGSLQALLDEPQISPTQNSSLLRQLGDAYAKIGECGKAILSYQKALKNGPSPEESVAIRAAMVRCQ